MIPGVRRAMVAKQREIGERTSVVMEGRDIGTVVFPDADVKIFLDADPEERVRRRLPRCAPRAIRSGSELARADAGARPARLAPAPRPPTQAPDAVYLDSTGLIDRGSGGGDSQDCARARLQRKGIPVENLLVMKFGGTSVGSAERMRVAAPHCRRGTARSGRWPSWFGDVQGHGPAAGYDAACRGRRPGGHAKRIWRLRERHEDACRELLPADRQAAVLAGIHELIGEFERIANGMAMLGERPPRSVDEAVAIGERLSALLVAAYLNRRARRGRRECARTWWSRTRSSATHRR